jgi:hypothetical protein
VQDVAIKRVLLQKRVSGFGNPSYGELKVCSEWHFYQEKFFVLHSHYFGIRRTHSSNATFIAPIKPKT